MLPLVSTAIPRLTGTRSALKCVTCTGWSSSYTAKSSWRSPGTNRPFASATVAVTLISSTPLLNRNDEGSGGCVCCAAATIDATAIAAAVAARRARALRSCTFVDMGHDACFCPEAHAITRHVGSAGNVDDERRIASRPKRRRVDRCAAAAEKAADAVEHEHDRGQTVDARGACGVAHDAADRQPI